MTDGRFLLVAALGLVTSCVPAENSVRPKTALAAPETDPRALLKALALRVPDAPLPSAASDAAFAAPLASAPPFLATPRTADDAARATDCLTQAVYYEARSEPIDGQRAVAQVVLNRVRDRAFPHSVCGVVYQHGARSSGCQFTFTCDGALNAPIEPRAWDRARAVAEAALAGGVYAPVGAAVFYHTQAVSPWWAPSLSRIGSIGSHIFYRWHDALARSLSFHQDYAGLEPVPSLAPAAATAVAFRPNVVLEGGVAIHREGATMPSAPVVESAGVRIHYATIAAPTASDTAPPEGGAGANG